MRSRYSKKNIFPIVKNQNATRTGSASNCIFGDHEIVVARSVNLMLRSRHSMKSTCICSDENKQYQSIVSRAIKHHTIRWPSSLLIFLHSNTVENNGDSPITHTYSISEHLATGMNRVHVRIHNKQHWSARGEAAHIFGHSHIRTLSTRPSEGIQAHLVIVIKYKYALIQSVCTVWYSRNALGSRLIVRPRFRCARLVCVCGARL